MRYVIIPTEEASLLFTDGELSTMRKSLDGTQIIAHEETLLRKRQESGLSTLPANGSDGLEWTYPVYDFGSVELQSLLASPEWYQEHNLTEN